MAATTIECPYCRLRYDSATNYSCPACGGHPGLGGSSPLDGAPSGETPSVPTPSVEDVAFLRDQAEQHLAVAERRAGMVHANVNPERDATMAARNRELAARYTRIADTLALCGVSEWRVPGSVEAPTPTSALEALERLAAAVRDNATDPDAPDSAHIFRRDMDTLRRALSGLPQPTPEQIAALSAFIDYGATRGPHDGCLTAQQVEAAINWRSQFGPPSPTSKEG